MRNALFLLTALLLGHLCATLALAERVSLRGYGTVTATVTPTRSEFVCENDAKADLLLGKLLADLFWDTGANHVEKTVEIDGKAIRLHECPPYGAMIAARRAHRVLVLGGDDAATVTARAAKEPFFTASNTQFAPSTPYPVYLDYYDLRAFKAYTHGTIVPNSVIDRWQFMKQYGFGGLTIQNPIYRNMLADGVNSWSLLDYEFAAAEEANKLHTPSISTGTWPTWAWNKNPENIAQESALSLTGSGVDHYNANRESLGLTKRERESTSLRLVEDTVRRYRDRIGLGGWQLYCASYYFETFFAREPSSHYDYSAKGQEGFRRWLRETRKYSLNDLGKRWYGDAGHFNAWSEVTLPEEYNGFFGNLNADCLRIADGWYWRKAEAGPATLPADDAPGWVPIEMPPSRQIDLLPMGPAYYRVAFDAGAWLKGHQGNEVYLVCDINNAGKLAHPIWLNGESLGSVQSTERAFHSPFAVQVTGKLHAGLNKLVIQVPGNNGHILGPIFLTTTRPVWYPYWGKQQNARYVDMLDWQLSATNNKVNDTMAFVRGLDPNSPLIIPNGSSVISGDGQGEAVARFGGSLQMTGREAWYHPWWARMGYVSGFYGSSEPSAPIQTESGLDRTLGWILFDGDGSHYLFWDIDSYLDLEKKTGWFTRNKRLVELFGKSLPEPPQLVLYRSSRNALYGDEQSTFNWDLGRGELQSAHYDNVYVTDSMLASGLAQQYPVLVDTGSMIMDESTVKAIRRYVEAGGTFVALHHTGRHSVLEPDTWQIPALAGFKVTSVGQKGIVRFEQRLPIFTGWEGKEFPGEGSSQDWMKTETAKDVCLRMSPVTKSAVTLARWEDGSTAIGMRKLGRGRIIILGSTFWRAGQDLQGVWRAQSNLERAFLERLFTDLGIRRNATADDPGVWVRKAITKNGLQEWAVAFNSTDNAVTTNVRFAAVQRPSIVWDILTEQPVTFDYADGWVEITDVAMPAYATRVYGVKRQTLAGGLDAWWGEKTKFWKSAGVAPRPTPAVETPAAPPALPFESWKFMADTEGAYGNTPDWAKVAFVDDAWRTVTNGPWNLQDPSLREYQGVGLYRSQPFTLPSAWDRRPVILKMSPAAGMRVFDRCECYLNGIPIGEYTGGYQQWDVSAFLRPGRNVLAIKVTGGKYVLNGLNATVWLQPQRALSAVQSLAGEWQAILGDFVTRQPATVPGKVKAKYLTRDIVVPAAWRGKQVFLRFDIPDRQTGLFMINGQPIIVYAQDAEVNLTPFLRFGEQNTLQWWPAATRNGANDETNIEIRSLELGCE